MTVNAQLLFSAEVYSFSPSRGFRSSSNPKIVVGYGRVSTIFKLNCTISKLLTTLCTNAATLGLRCIHETIRAGMLNWRILPCRVGACIVKIERTLVYARLAWSTNTTYQKKINISSIMNGPVKFQRKAYYAKHAATCNHSQMSMRCVHSFILKLMQVCKSEIFSVLAFCLL